jgi:hypothetical protein
MKQCKSLKAAKRGKKLLDKMANVFPHELSFRGKVFVPGK